MTWRNLCGSTIGSQPDSDHLMSLLTLSLVEGVCEEELTFYADAERSALQEWRRNGLILLALCETSTSDLMIVSPRSPTEIHYKATMLPYVAAELATVDVKAMMLADIDARL